jgi:drug/metabolite transporter (DMT)-like permease
VSFQTFLGLILCNLVWSVHPIFGKWLLEELTPADAAWLRYMSAFLGYWCLAFFLKRKSESFFLVPERHQDKFLLILLGFMTFCFSPLIQITGLASSLASENAIIVAMEPLMTAFLAWAILREKITWFDTTAFSLALFGFAFLAGITPRILQQGFGPHFKGNVLILVSLMGEASYTILARRLTGRYSPLGVFGASLTLGVIFLSLAVFYLGGAFHFPALHLLSWKTWLALFWIGPVGTAGAYLYLMFALVRIPVMSVTVFLFLQPLAGALWGYLILGDRLTYLQQIGSGLILCAVLIPNMMRLKKRSIH